MGRRARRLIFFVLTLLIGAAAGLAYGWVANPVEFKDASPDTLGMAYQTDYALMVAELYQADGDIPLAASRLSYLGEGPLLDLVNVALIHAEASDYPSGDMQILRDLATALVLSQREGQ